MKSLWCFVFLFIRINLIVAWESYELDLFDLVEEIGLNTNFYDFIGVEKTAEVSEIKKAYRKLSLSWHPDKSDEPDAGERFRRLVAVYEMLKDDQRRARYDRILVEGLPKWNQPMFYFRRAKKLRFWEIVTILTFIMTIGHYLVLWAIYFESTLAMVKMKDRWIVLDFLSIPVLKAPQFVDILPIKFAFFLIDHQFLIPYMKNLLQSILKSRSKSSSTQSSTVDNEENANDTDYPMVKKSPVVRMNDIVPEMATNPNAPIVPYISTPVSPTETNSSSDVRKSTRSWSDEEKQLLCKTIVRFPPGTPRRWEKIAEVLGRRVSQVTDMAKQIQNTVGSNTNHIFQENPSSYSTTTTTIDQNLITERATLDSAADWSQTDQHLLECALKTMPKDMPGADRWEQIALCIPGKTRDECLARYRYIVQRVKAKKMV
ncbi:unnamed protein product [Adineta ricciae]|uniref:DnaJ-like protein n=1 Tax=Adineta ricciae TaxID=249248 RepID=A0A814SML6_ADIRI|nr:unnamed protein product [Adineta ricciae]